MPNYRRAIIPGGAFFFTVVTCDRTPIFLNLKISMTVCGKIISLKDDFFLKIFSK